MSLNCPICLKQNFTSKHLFQDNGRDINVLYCKNCDFEYLDTWQDVDFVKSLYSGNKYVFTHNVSNKKDLTLKFDEYKNNYIRIKPFLNKETTFLEIGCGDGKFLNMVKNDVKEVECIELSPPQVKKLRSEGFTCYDVMIEDLKIDKKYDVICLFAVLEHVPNLQEFLKKMKTFLKPDGKIFLEIPNRKNVLFSSYNIEEFRKFYYRSIHLYYFSPKSLKKVLDKTGFSSEILTEQQASITNHFHWLHNKKGQPNANAMTSIFLPEENHSNEIIKILNKVDDNYRKILEDKGLGDLLFAKLECKFDEIAKK